MGLGDGVEALSSCHLPYLHHGLIEVDSSAIMAPFDSNLVMLGPRAKLFFQRLYGPAPFPLVSKAVSPFPHILPVSSFPLAVPELYLLQ